MSWERMLGTALVVGVIGPLFWLGVNMLENWLKRLVSDRKAKKAATADGRLLK